jgi:hypothetical protein
MPRAPLVVKAEQKSVVFPAGVTSMCGEDVMESVTSQPAAPKSDLVPSAAVGSGRAFWWCTALTSVRLPGAARWVGSCAFRESGIRRVVIPSGLGIGGRQRPQWWTVTVHKKGGSSSAGCWTRQIQVMVPRQARRGSLSVGASRRAIPRSRTVIEPRQVRNHDREGVKLGLAVAERRGILHLVHDPGRYRLAVGWAIVMTFRQSNQAPSRREDSRGRPASPGATTPVRPPSRA